MSAQPIPAATSRLFDLPPLPVRKFTLDEYHKLQEIGVLKDGEPIELLEGWIALKMGKNPPHVYAVDQTADLFAAMLSPGWYVRKQDPISTPDSEPEPDVTVVRGNKAKYRKRHPLPNEVAVLVEIANSTLQEDRNVKSRVYARSRIAQYWIVNLIERQVEVYTDPSSRSQHPHYRKRQDYPAGTSVPVVVDGREIGRIPVDELLS
jgi:Uma2 family endonuclease